MFSCYICQVNALCSTQIGLYFIWLWHTDSGTHVCLLWLVIFLIPHLDVVLKITFYLFDQYFVFIHKTFTCMSCKSFYRYLFTNLTASRFEISVINYITGIAVGSCTGMLVKERACFHCRNKRQIALSNIHLYQSWTITRGMAKEVYNNYYYIMI